jgi:hypothetical protein
MHLKIVGVLLAGAMLPSIALAEFVYTGVEVSYVDVEIDTGFGTLDGDGYRFTGTYQMNSNAFLLGEWEEQSFDFGADGRKMEFGAGYRHALSNSLDLVATASYVNAEVSAQGLSVDDDGLGLGGGIRAQLGPSFQVEAMLRWVDFDNSGSDTGLDLLGRYYFSDRFAFMIRTDLDDDVDTLSLGFRAEF